MRIALCINGQPRTWRRCYKTWLDNISHLGSIDVFYHMWDYNTLPNSVHSIATGNPMLNTKVPQEELDDIWKLLRPKSFLVESAKPMPVQPVANPIAPWTISQFYAIYRCAMLKREYEIANGFEYDAVVRIRTDLVLNAPMTIPAAIDSNSVYTFINHHDPVYETYRIGDVLYFADSYSYDQISNFYFGLQYIDATDIGISDLGFPPELAFYHYLKSLGLKNISNIADFKIARSEEFSKLKGGLDPYEVL